MTKRLKLSRKRQALVVEYVPLADVLAKYFLQNRPPWQRGVLVDDLRSEGLLAITKAARTYDPKRLPYPKAYFARACLNAMYKQIKKINRQPGDIRITLAEAEELMPDYDHMDHLRLAIADLPVESQAIATDRFVGGQTLRSLAQTHQISLRSAARQSSHLSRTLAESLDIRLQPRDTGSGCRSRNSTPARPSCSSACASPCGKGVGRLPGK
jgi:RNA polymerase sigma factor (sigma-70 family)